MWERDVRGRCRRRRAAGLLAAADPSASNGAIVGRLARNADAAGTASETGNGRLNLERALADTSTDAVKPAGAQPADGGPFVGPYVVAAPIVNVDVAVTYTPLSPSPANPLTAVVRSYTVLVQNTLAKSGNNRLGCISITPPPSFGIGSGAVTGTFRLEVTAEGPWSIIVPGTG